MISRPFIPLLLACLQAYAADLTIHVSPAGKDTWSGTLASPAADGNDGPLATIKAARDAVRSARLNGIGGAVTVEIQAGVYELKTPLVLGSEDSGRLEAPVAYRAAEGQRVVLTAGERISKWAILSDPELLARLPEEARGKVVVSDLRRQGIEAKGKLSVRGNGHHGGVAEAELICDSMPMTLARWPNHGFRGATGMKSQTSIGVDTDRMKRWSDEGDPWIFAYWHHDWADLCEPIVGMDPAARILVRSSKVQPIYGITPSRARWYGLNLFSELDSPGEYYIDRENGRLYFWPPREGRMVLTSGIGLLRGKDVSHVEFRGLVFEACRGRAVQMEGGTGVSLVGCTFQNIGGDAIRMTGGSRHSVIGCDVRHTGTGGIHLSGGDRPTLTPGRHNVENNHVHHYSRRVRVYRPAIRVAGVGNRIAHNLVHDGPHLAISAPGNDHIIEFNEVHNVVQESGDAGAYYVGRDWTQRGNQVRYNYWHQIGSRTGMGGMTVYLDDQHCGHSIYGNIFERCSRAVFIGGGDDNKVTGNVFIDCWKAVSIDDRGLKWQRKETMDPDWMLQTRLRAMPYQSPPWRKRYPELFNIMEDEFQIPKRNLITRNISVGGLWDNVKDSIRAYQSMNGNLVVEDKADWVRLVKDASGRPVKLDCTDPIKVRDIGIGPIDVARIGPYADIHRASWPLQRRVRPIRLPHDREK